MKEVIAFMLSILSIQGFAQQDSVFTENGKYLIVFYNDEGFKSNDTTPGLKACQVSEKDRSGCYKKIADTMYHENGSIFRVTTFIDQDHLKTIEYFSKNFSFKTNKLKGNKQSFTYQLGCIELTFGFSGNKVQRGWVRNAITKNRLVDFIGLNELQKADENNYVLQDKGINVTFDEHFKNVNLTIEKKLLLEQCKNITITQPMLKYVR